MRLLQRLSTLGIALSAPGRSLIAGCKFPVHPRAIALITPCSGSDLWLMKTISVHEIPVLFPVSREIGCAYGLSGAPRRRKGSAVGAAGRAARARRAGPPRQEGQARRSRDRNPGRRFPLSAPLPYDIIWQSASPPRSPVTLSIAMIGCPASSAAPNHFSVPSSVRSFRQSIENSIQIR